LIVSNQYLMEANMGPFDDMLKTGLSSTAGGGQQQPKMALATGILEMLTSQQTGGLQGLVQSFTQKGLGHIVSSWVSTGPNLPVSGDQIQSTLGSEAISSLAQRAGVAPNMAGSLLAQLLPAIVNHLTPEGKIPESGNLLEQGLSFLKGMQS
jgi:uncharacterized protein YidB (DUF937 family)